MDFSKFRTNEGAESEGVWVEVGDGFAILIGRIGGKRNQESYKRHTASPVVSEAIRRGTQTPEEQARIHGEVMADSILLGWRGLTEEGQDVPYSREKALELLRVKDFRALVHDEAMNQANFRVKRVEDTVAALKKSSNGNSDLARTENS